MNTTQFISFLRKQNIELKVTDGRLRALAPEGILTPDVKAQIGQRKAELLVFVEEAAKSRSSAPRLMPAGEEPPLSFAQERLWFLDQFQPGSGAYNVVVACNLAGELVEDRIRRALGEVCRRHEVLRTYFPAGANGRPHLKILGPDESTPELEIIQGADGDTDALLQGILLAEQNRVFSLGKRPPLRFVLLRLSPDQAVLVVSQHHILTDAWSLGILLQEFISFYDSYGKGAGLSLPEPTLQYRDFAWQGRQDLQGQALNDKIQPWLERLANRQTLEIPADFPRPVQPDYTAHSHEFMLSPELRTGLEDFARVEGVTLYTVLLTLYFIFLHKHTGGSDLLVGSPFAGRSMPGSEELIGLFVNILPLRLKFAGFPSFRVLTRAVHRIFLEAQAGDEVPFERLVQELEPERDPSRPPIFQSVFALQNAPLEFPRTSSLCSEPLDFAQLNCRFDLELHFQPRDGGLRGTLLCRRDLFQETTPGNWARRFETLARGALGRPDAGLERLSPLDTAEEAVLLGDWAGIGSAFPADKTIHALFEELAVREPERLAILDLSYGELNRQANVLAHELLARGVSLESPVGVCLEDPVDRVVALVAVLKAGAYYAPLDPAFPRERLAFMLEDSGAALILSREEFRPAFPEPEAGAKPGFLFLEDMALTLGAQDASNPEVAGLGPDQLAYMLYTSGSTGRPKGVRVPHQAVIRLVRNTDFAQVQPGDRVALLSNFAFDAMTFELWGALLNGATLVPLDKEQALLPDSLAGAIAGEGLTVMFLTTSLFHQLAHKNPAIFKGLKHLVVGGEALEAAAAHAVLEAGGPGRLINGYGPTENTTFSSWFEVRLERHRQGASVPIGMPIANSECYILSDDLSLAPVGVPGELFLGGPGLARDYGARPELTAEKFIPHPFARSPGQRLYRTGDLVRRLPNGLMEFMGRLDRQVKVRGFRIEIPEIEAALLELDFIAEAAVEAFQERSGTTGLAAYLVLEAGAELSVSPEASVREQLREKQPDYMIPAVFCVLEAMPLTSSGKLDRQALPAAGREAGFGRTGRTEILSPQSKLEKDLLAIWTEVLDRPDIGIQDDFFELGGHSLLAVRVVEEARRRLTCRIPLAAFFRNASIQKLAAYLERGGDEIELPYPLVELKAGGTDTPIFFVHPAGGSPLCYVALARLLGDNRPAYGLQAPGFEDDREPFRNVGEQARFYVDALRRFHPQGPCILAGWSTGGAVAYEMARLLGPEETQMLFLFDTSLPGFWANAGFLSSLNDISAMALNIVDNPAALSPRGFLEMLEDVGYRIPEDMDKNLLSLLRISPKILNEMGRFAPMFLYSYMGYMEYKAEPYEGDVTLFRVPWNAFGRLGGILGLEDPISRGWRKLVGGAFRSIEVPGHHTAMLERRFLGGIADEMRRLLE